MKENTHIPRFVSVVTIALGCIDLIRGFVHTILLEYAALNIAGFDFSNYLTGIMLILIGWKARPLALIMLGVIPVAYAIGVAGIRINSAAYAPPQAAWRGATPMLVYLVISAITFVAGVWMTRQRKKTG
jgi:hypothetical protein